jgi:hypothetical protein
MRGRREGGIHPSHNQSPWTMAERQGDKGGKEERRRRKRATYRKVPFLVPCSIHFFFFLIRQEAQRQGGTRQHEDTREIGGTRDEYE